MTRPSQPQAPIDVAVELDPSAVDLVQAGTAAELCGLLRAELVALAEDLAICADLELRLITGQAAEFPERVPYTVAIDGTRCRLLLEVVQAAPWSARRLAWSIASDIARNRHLLLPARLCEAIRASWHDEAGAASADWNADAFRELLLLLVERGSRINRLRAGGEPLDGAPCDEPVARRFEALIGGLDATAIHVLLSRSAHQRAHSAASSPGERSLAEQLAAVPGRMFSSLGLIVPQVQLGVDERLDDDAFRFQLNDLRLPPASGLRPDQLMIDGAPQAIEALGASADSAADPLDGHSCWTVTGSAETLDRLRNAFTAQGPAEFIERSLRRVLRESARHLLTCEAVSCSLDLLRQRMPVVVDTALRRFDVAQLTWVLRALLAEQISVRDLHAVLEGLLSIEAWGIGRRERPGKNASFHLLRDSEWVRAELKHWISYEYCTGYDTLVVHLLSSEIENRIADSEAHPLSAEERHGLLASVLRTLGDRSAPRRPVILTRQEIRTRLKNLLDVELPSVAVLSYQELAPDLNVQPVAKIE